MDIKNYKASVMEGINILVCKFHLDKEAVLNENGKKYIVIANCVFIANGNNNSLIGNLEDLNIAMMWRNILSCMQSLQRLSMYEQKFNY